VSWLPTPLDVISGTSKGAPLDANLPFGGWFTPLIQQPPEQIKSLSVSFQTEATTLFCRSQFPLSGIDHMPIFPSSCYAVRLTTLAVPSVSSKAFASKEIQPIVYVRLARPTCWSRPSLLRGLGLPIDDWSIAKPLTCLRALGCLLALACFP